MKHMLSDISIGINDVNSRPCGGSDHEENADLLRIVKRKTTDDMQEENIFIYCNRIVISNERKLELA